VSRRLTSKDRTPAGSSLYETEKPQNHKNLSRTRAPKSKRSQQPSNKRIKSLKLPRATPLKGSLAFGRPPVSGGEHVSQPILTCRESTKITQARRIVPKATPSKFKQLFPDAHLSLTLSSPLRVQRGYEQPQPNGRRSNTTSDSL
jgi:hypothetical protein